MLTKIIGFFIPPVPEGNNEYQRRVRLITYALFITALFSLFYVGVSWLSGYAMGVVIMLCGFIVFTALLFLLKSGVNVYAYSKYFRVPRYHEYCWLRLFFRWRNVARVALVCHHAYCYIAASRKEERLCLGR
jgi:hypothetical protein